MIKAIVFDLDFTLYDYRVYLDGAYAHLARAFARRNGIDPDASHQALIAAADQFGYTYDLLFNEWLSRLGRFSDPAVRECIRLYHSFQGCDIRLYPGVQATFQGLCSHKIGILTDGYAPTQRRKVQKLNLDALVPHILYTHDLQTSKPDAAVFIAMAERLDCAPADMLYVGDHPRLDVKGALCAGARAVRIRRGEYMNLPDEEGYAPDYTIEAIQELLDCPLLTR